MKTNVAMFDEYLVNVLVTLYQEFPVITHLDTQVITGHEQIDKNGNALDPYGYPSKEVEVCSATIEWLIKHKIHQHYRILWLSILWQFINAKNIRCLAITV